jgi:hypothetical protein
MVGRIGVILVLANLLGWTIFYFVAPVAPPRSWTPPPPTRPGEFHLFDCWDCPHLRLLDREFGSHWDPLPVKLLALANLPCLLLASGPRDYFDFREIRPVLFVVSMVLQWFGVGALAGVLYRAVFRSRGDGSRNSLDAKPSASSPRS